MAYHRRVNIAIAGGPCTGKSTLAACLFAALKNNGYDYDLVTEECRKLKKEFGNFRSPFERFYMWREELRSTALDGFITDKPLFHYYVQAMQYSTEERDKLAVRELFRMCTEIEDRYQLIVIAKNHREFPYKNDQSRRSNGTRASERHALVRSFVEHLWPEKLFLVEGGLEERVSQVIKKLESLNESPTGHLFCARARLLN